jgi:hypothetical protein
MRGDGFNPLQDHRQFVGVNFADGLIVLLAGFGAVAAVRELAVS